MSGEDDVTEADAIGWDIDDVDLDVIEGSLKRCPCGARCMMIKYRLEEPPPGMYCAAEGPDA